MWRLCGTTVFAVLLAAAAPSGAHAACPAEGPWPTDQWPTAEDAVDSDAVAQLEAYAFSPEGLDTDRDGVRTNGLLLVKAGQIIYERYARGFQRDKPHLAWSISKSLTNALVGAAVHRGLVQLEASICDYWPGENCDIRLVDLLELASGLDWNELYEGQGNQASSVLAMLYGEGHADMGRFVRQHPLRAEPGTTFAYSSGDTTLLTAVLGEAVAAELGSDFPWDLLFDRIGMSSATWERDAAGHFVGGSLAYASPRDLARFGYLYLRDGCWQGERILPESWVSSSTSVSQPFLQGPEVQASMPPGRSLWLNRRVPDRGFEERPWPDVPADAFAARGHWGQSVTVIPSLELIVVRTADDRDGQFSMNQFLELAIAAAGGSGS